MLYVKLLFALVIMGGLAGGVTYVYKLKADLATSEANNAKLENSMIGNNVVFDGKLLLQEVSLGDYSEVK